MSELCGSVAAVQLKKLPEIVDQMRASKRRIKALLQGTAGIQFRRLNDEAGDTGPFLILTLDDPHRAEKAAERLRDAGFGL